MNPTESHELWQDMVAATSEFGSDATALRVPLWIALQMPRPSIRRQAKDFLAGAAQFLSTTRTKLPATPKAGVVFCFAHRTPSNMNNLLPVAREALRRGVLGGIVMGGDFSDQLREFAGAVPIVSAQQLTGRLGMRERIKGVDKLGEVYRQISSALRKRRPDLSSSLTANRAAFIEALTNSVLFGSAIAWLLDTWSPSCVISTSDFWPLEHQLCCQASRKQIPSVVIQHGTIDRFWWPFVADLYCMWGDTDVHQMRDFGAPAEKLAALGMPATDEIFRQAETTQQESTGGYRQPVCLILSNSHGSSLEPAIFDKYRQFLTEAVNLMPSVTWKVKLHPAEDGSFYRQIERSVFERLEFHPKDISLQEAVTDADVVTTIYSTAGLEAMIMDRPLIVAPLTPRVRELAPWPETGGGTYSSSAADFCAQLTKLISDQVYRTTQMDQQRQFLAKNFANCGHSAERIVDLLERYSSHLPVSKAQPHARGEAAEALLPRLHSANLRA